MLYKKGESRVNEEIENNEQDVVEDDDWLDTSKACDIQDGEECESCQ